MYQEFECDEVQSNLTVIEALQNSFYESAWVCVENIFHNKIPIPNLSDSYWEVQTIENLGHKETILVSLGNNDIENFRSWYKKTGLNLTPKQYSKFEDDIQNLIMSSKWHDYSFFQTFEYNLSQNILSIRIHVGLEHRNGIGGNKDGHVGLEFQGYTYHYFWTRGVNFDHFKNNPFATWPGEVRVDPSNEFSSYNGHGYHRGNSYNDPAKPPRGLGEDFYFEIPLTIEQYLSLSSDIIKYNDEKNRVGVGVPNYGFFGRQFIFFGPKQRRCMSWVNSILLESGIDIGAGVLPMHPVKVFNSLRKLGYAEKQLTAKESLYNSQW